MIKGSAIIVWRVCPCCCTFAQTSLSTLLHSAPYLCQLYKQNWLQFLFVVEATALQQQISKFYPHIISTEANYHHHQFIRQ